MMGNDAELDAIVDKVKSGDHVNLFVDTVVDSKTEPFKKMQPHVVIRPRKNIISEPDVGQGTMATFNAMRKRQMENAEKAAASKNAHVTAETVMSDYKAEDDFEDEGDRYQNLSAEGRSDKDSS
ncbi:hypothetical protein AgCh_024420 [Apium graveolens]